MIAKVEAFDWRDKEIYALRAQLDVAKKAMKKRLRYDQPIILRDMYVIPFSEIERLGKESGINLTKSQEDGKDGENVPVGK